MSTNYQLKIVKMPDVTELAGEKVMIDFESGKYFMLTGAANDIWDLFPKVTTSDEIVAGLMEIYDVPKEICTEEVNNFLNKLSDIGFIEIEELA